MKVFFVSGKNFRQGFTEDLRNIDWPKETRKLKPGNKLKIKVYKMSKKRFMKIPISPDLE